MELGYLFILATLVQAVLAGGLLILLPLFFLGKVHRKADQPLSVPKCSDIIGALFYFGCLGMAFMFLEMALLPKYTLLLSHPVYSVAFVLSVLMIFAGCGSMCVRYFQERGSWYLWIPVLFIGLWTGLHVAGDSWLFQRALAWSLGGRLTLSVLVLSGLAFFLGWPFPWGLRVISKRFPTLVPWSWGMNGCASVVGAVLGKCLAISLGFRLLMVTACILYALAIAVFYISFRDVRIDNAPTGIA
jgi:hypothetical protein